MGASYHRATCYVKHYLAVYPNPNGWTMYVDSLYLIGGPNRLCCLRSTGSI